MLRWLVKSHSPEQTRALGQTLGELLGASTLILLSGDLGAGKTCFTQGVARGLAVPEDEPVVSPSYTLMNHYGGRLDLYHFDFYRLTSSEDLFDLGFDEYIRSDGVTVVEWGDRFPELTLEGIRAHFKYGEDEKRMIDFRAEGQDNLVLLEHFRCRWLSLETDR